MRVRTRRLLNCQHLLIHEHFDANRSDVSQTGIVQANGEVRRPANGSRNKVIIFRKRRHVSQLGASRNESEERLTEDARNAERRGGGVRRSEHGLARRVEHAEGGGARASAAGDGRRGGRRRRRTAGQKTRIVMKAGACEARATKDNQLTKSCPREALRDAGKTHKWHSGP